MTTIENEVIKTPQIQFDEECGGLGVLLFELCQKHKERIALINTKNDEFYTYNNLLKNSKSTAVAFQKRGLKRHDLVALCSNKENLNANLPLIAAQFLGCISYSVGPDLSVEEYVELLQQVPPKLIFCIESARPKLNKVLEQLGWPQSVLVQFGQQFEEEFLNDGHNDSFKPVHVDDLKETCVIHFSSGSTATPKPICLNHYYFLALQRSVGMNPWLPVQTNQFSGFMLGPVSLRYSNWYWVSVSFEQLIFMTYGGCRLLKDNFVPEEFWADVEKYHVSDVMLTPLHCIELSNSKIPNGANVSSFKKLITGGTRLHEDFIRKLWQLLPDLKFTQIYGTTECGEITCFNLELPLHRKLVSEKPQSCGLPIAGVHYKIIDLDTGKKCGPNQPGELYIKNKHLFNGFYNSDCSTSFDEEGFFKTGDLVYYDEEFCFFVLDRIKSVLRWKNHWLIYPYHIEQVLLSHPAVCNAVVIGIPHKTEGERPMGVVMIKKGFEDVTEKELEKFVEKKVENHKRLREGVKFVKSIPTTDSGKVSRFKVKQMILNNFNFSQ